MKIRLNDKDYSLVEGTTLARFVESIDLPPRGIAIAIEGEVIPRARWAETLLHDGCELMLIHAVSGG